jgi:hypothetical protein
MEGLKAKRGKGAGYYNIGRLFREIDGMVL